MRINSLKIAWQLFQHEKQHAHVRFLHWTQALLMLFIMTLSQTGQNIQVFLSENLSNLLGADVVISQSQTLTDQQLDELSQFSNNMSVTQSIVTTITHDKQWQRTRLKGVEQNYPLQGHLQATNVLGGELTIATAPPKPGEIWLDSRLFAALSIDIGQRLMIGDSQLVVTRVLGHEPDRLMEGHNVDMRALVNITDLEKLQFPSDLIQYRYLIETGSDSISSLIAWQEEHLPAAQLVHKQGAHPLALFWKRTENFMGLASIILFFMAAIAIEQLTRVQVRKEQYFVAVSMSVGASKWMGFHISLLKWIIKVGSLLPLVLLMSALSHALLIHWLASTFEGLSWQWSMTEMFTTLLAVFSMLFVFQLPVWVGLKQSSIAQLVNGSHQRVAYGIQAFSVLTVLIGVAYVYSDNGLLTLMVLGAIAVSIVLILVVSWFSMSIGERVTQRQAGLVPFALFMMRQRLVSKSTQILGLGLCAFLLLFTLMLMRDLGNTMSVYQRQHDGNLMVSQASQVQMQYLHQWAKDNEIQIRQEKPFMYASLAGVNQQRLKVAVQSPSESLARFERPIRLHWSNSVPTNNRVVDGQWWATGTAKWQQVSLEQEVMVDLGLNIGDVLTFSVGQQSVDFELVASHVYRPGAGSITFWVQMPESAVTHLHAAHFTMASLELESEQFSLLSELWRKFPSLRMTSLQELTERFDATLSMVTKVISGFALLIVVLALIVIFSTSHAVETKEKKKNSVIMSFGFNKATCLRLSIIEWLTTGLIAAMGAIVGTYAGGLMIYQSQFSLTYEPDLMWLLGTLIIIMMIVTGVGVLASQNSLKGSVRALMQEQ